MQQKNKYYPGIDLLRFLVAAVIAFLYHFGIIYHASPYIEIRGMNFLYTYGYLGVELFFMVSGFVMFLSFDIQKNTFSHFLKKRIIRIYPVMIITTIIAAIGQWVSLGCFGHVSALEVGDGRNTLEAFVLNIIGVQCGWSANHDSMSINGPTWFISIVMICYMLFYVIMKYCGNEKEKMNICFALLIVIGIYLGQHNIDFPLLYESCGRGYTSFFIGTLMAQIVVSIDTEKKRWSALLMAGLSIVLYFEMYRLNNLGNIGITTSLVLNTAIIILITQSKIIRMITDNKFISWLGKISFSIYLWNIPIAIWFYLICEVWDKQIEVNKSLFWMHILISIVLAELTHVFFEKPVTAFFNNKMKENNNNGTN